MHSLFSDDHVKYVPPLRAMSYASIAPFSTKTKLSAMLNVPNFSLVDRAADLLAGLFNFSVPEAYEDETGFHYVMDRSGLPRPPADGPVWLGEYI
jgi:hypothetical protein